MKARIVLSVVMVSLAAAGQARALLTAEQIVLIANSASADSKAVAEYYCKQRGVPAANVCLLELPTREYMSHEQYADSVVPAVKKFLADGKLADKVRCLLMVYDVPLKIQPRKPAGKEGEDKAALDKAIAELSKQLWQCGKAAEGIATAASPATSRPVTERLPEPPEKLGSLRDLIRSASAALDAARGRIEKMTDAAQRALEGRDWTNLSARLRGMPATAQQLAVWKRSFPEDEGLAKAAEQTAQLARQYQKQAGDARQGGEQSLTVQQQIDLQLHMAGLIGTVAGLQNASDEIGGRETAASFDSEISLLYAPQYRLNRWQGNPMYLHKSQTALGFRALMTARIDGPTVEIAKRLVDDAIAVEKTGLTGKVYIDARGMKDPNPMGEGYGGYDASLREMAAFIQKHTKLEVVLDDTGALFGGDKPTKESCPDAALYCGWYRLSHYVDSFTWVRGAVGYHIASGEATTLRSKGSQVWCKRMIEEGVDGTCGPTFEPYLQAFPRPHHFFALLLTGETTLAETYWQTVPWTSWAMVLVGDPLYNPFGKTPLVKAADLPFRYRG